MRPAAPTEQEKIKVFSLDYLLDTINDLRVRVARLERRFVSSLPGGGEAEDAPQDLEASGNIVCLPGVKLADVLDNGGGPQH